jgi:histidinol dehydrogenase
MIAGPSEVLVIADETADPALIAIDLMAQSEHDERAATYLVTTDATLPARVEVELTCLLDETPRAEMTAASLKDNGLFIVCENITDVVAASDVIAPEHLEIMTVDAPEVADAINNAGAIFIGKWTPESVGDYVAGPNHVLPTGGTARFSSPLTTDDFIKKTSILHYTEKGLARDLSAIETIAASEGLWAHGKAATMRFESCE